MLHKEDWGFNQSWLDYVYRVWTGAGRVELKSDDSIERLQFHDKAKQSFLALGYPVRFVKTYVSVQLPESGDGYADQYPHVHYPLDGFTLVHYLQSSDKPIPLDVFNGDEVVESIYSQAGLTVFFMNNVKHGAKKNTGTIPRIQMIATALR